MQELSNRELSRWFWGSPTGKKIVKEAADQHTAKRTEAVAAIAAIDAKFAKEFPTAQKAFDKAEAAYQAAVQALNDALAARNAAYVARHNFVHRAENEKRPHEKLLRDTADERIVELYSAISRADSVEQGVDRNNTQTNHTQRVQLRRNRLDAMHELDVLWQEALTETELTGRLAAIAKSANIETPVFAGVN